MRAGRRGGVLIRLLKEPCSGGADEGKNGGPAKNVDVSKHCRLLLQQPIDEAEGARPCSRRAHAMAKISGDHGGFLLEHRPGGSEIRSQIVLVEVGAADERSG